MSCVADVVRYLGWPEEEAQSVLLALDDWRPSDAEWRKLLRHIQERSALVCGIAASSSSVGVAGDVAVAASFCRHCSHRGFSGWP